MIESTQPEWYKDAVIYQLHIKAFFDSNNDGIGDFQGLIQKLDYVQELGVNTVWVLPFYPSPLRDDGYDIGDYRNINPSFGTMRDFRRFVRAAHERGLRVITELVINHTSDQHRWFQRARYAKKGSAHRNYYVWSDTDKYYEGTRIIFIDSEQSNWSWDPVAQQYYWHRFYSHQPDLNFDNPQVMREVLSVLHFWLNTGVDGLRLDAIPYLVERDGTNNENLPETHAVLKRIRAEVDQHFEGRMLLAEANQWPEDVLPYFGDGDECHMAFHFPLMPRMYMALAQEDRHPIADILRQTPDVPPNCQWGIFLRNHDELTLEMVTDKERDYLWNVYASDRRMRINLGIRRRLAPLLDNDLRKIQLMNSLLLSMPGTPIVYYGDEIGMGDNIYLGDRDGVRTPMQWSPDRSGGFSRADPAKLYLPAIMDPIYGFDAVNVEAQHRDPSSLLNWMRRMIAVRLGHKAFGRGTLRLLYPRNRKILAYVREYQDEEVMLCVVNLSRSAQAVELDLSEFKDHVPIELLGRSAFPPVGDLPYLLTLPAYGFYWFALAREAEIPRWHLPIPEPLDDFFTLVVREGWQALVQGQSRRDFTGEVIPKFARQQRWFAAKDETVLGSSVVSWAHLPGPGEGFFLGEVAVELSGEPAQHYFLPLATSYDEQALAFGWPLLPYTLAQVRRGPKVGALVDAAAVPEFPPAALKAMRGGTTLKAGDGEIRFWSTSAMAEVDLDAEMEVKPLGVEQSNSSIRLGQQVIFKAYRRLAPGVQPELEIGRFLVEEAGYHNTPPLLGAIERVGADGESTAWGAAFGFVLNQGDGWAWTVDYLSRTLDDLRLMVTARTDEDDIPLDLEEPHGMYLAQVRVLGERTAEVHRAFAVPSEDPAFAAEPIGESDLETWREAAIEQAAAAVRAIRQALTRLEHDDRALAERLLEQEGAIADRIEQLTGAPVEATKTRVHGDYHLGQVLVAKADFYLLDFEGEPARPLAERRIKTSPMKDVAGMLRSFDYAAETAVSRAAEVDPGTTETIAHLARVWRDATTRSFLDGYRSAVGDCSSFPRDPRAAARLAELFLFEKALYEICYEAANRPTWLRIPIAGVLSLLENGSAMEFSDGED